MGFAGCVLRIAACFACMHAPWRAHMCEYSASLYCKKTPLVIPHACAYLFVCVHVCDSCIQQGDVLVFYRFHHPNSDILSLLTNNNRGCVARAEKHAILSSLLHLAKWLFLSCTCENLCGPFTLGRFFVRAGKPIFSRILASNEGADTLEFWQNLLSDCWSLEGRRQY